MTEQEQDREFLSRLIGQPFERTSTASIPPLSSHVERQLLQEANRVAPITLAPVDTSAPNGASASFAGEALDIVRRHPLPSLLIAAGVAYLLTRRRNR
jgi:hypothetical protein